MRIRQEWWVAIVAVGIALAVIAFVLTVRNTDGDLGVTPTNVHEEPAP